jgi:FMN-dependent NADH-azoreductase
MTSLLQINSSIFHNDGQSSQLADQFVSAWINKHQETQLVIRDLAKNPLSHLNAERAQAFVTKPDLRSAQQQKLVAESDLLINELKGAEIIVTGLPMC